MNKDYVGLSMKEMDVEDLRNIYGAQGAEMQAAWTSAVSNLSAKTLTTSKSTKLCLSAASITLISRIVSYNLDCLG